MCVRVCARTRVPVRATLMSISGPPLFPAAPELMMPRLAFFSSLEMFSLGRCAHVGVTFRSDFSRRSHITSRGMSPGCTAGSHRRGFDDMRGQAVLSCSREGETFAKSRAFSLDPGIFGLIVPS